MEFGKFYTLTKEPGSVYKAVNTSRGPFFQDYNKTHEYIIPNNTPTYENRIIISQGYIISGSDVYFWAFDVSTKVFLRDGKVDRVIEKNIETWDWTPSVLTASHFIAVARLESVLINTEEVFRGIVDEDPEPRLGTKDPRKWVMTLKDREKFEAKMKKLNLYLISGKWRKLS